MHKGGELFMKINLMRDGKKLTMMLDGRLDSFTAPELETVIDENLNGIEELVMDLENLEYISSAGLRVLLGAQKLMNKKGDLTLTGVCEEVMDVFEMTGYADILTIE